MQSARLKACDFFQRTPLNSRSRIVRTPIVVVRTSILTTAARAPVGMPTWVFPANRRARSVERDAVDALPIDGLPFVIRGAGEGAQCIGHAV